MIDRIRELVEKTTPPDSTVIFISKGDENLISVPDRRTGHFPQDEDGNFAAHYPAGSAEAINQLEDLVRTKGAEYLVVPGTALWWLDHFADFANYLETRHRRVAWRPEMCAIFELRHKGTGPPNE